MTSQDLIHLLKSGKKPPDNLIVYGHLLMRDLNVYKSMISETTYYSGDELYCYDECDFILPDYLTIIGDLNLHNTKIKKLPKSLTVQEDLVLPMSPTIVKLPKDLLVCGVFLHNRYQVFRKEYESLTKYKELLTLNPKHIKTIKRMLYIPEIYGNVFYERKSEFISLLQKL